MKIIKRNGSEVEFDKQKIINAIGKANAEVDKSVRLNDEQIRHIATRIERQCEALNRAPTVEEVQDLVESQIMEAYAFEVAKRYVRYRYERELVRKANSTDEKILSLIENANEEAKQENSNKNPVINSVQRDYMAGEVSRDLTQRLLLPKDVVKADREGLIHFHDQDYYSQHMHNCFDGETVFLTKDGPRKFADCKDGETVIVYDKDGIEREATVKKHGEQIVQIITLKEKNTGKEKVVKATFSHRWLLKDGTVTTSIRSGMELYVPENLEPRPEWFVKNVDKHLNVRTVWCVSEPVTHSFMLEDNIPTGNCDLVNLGDMLQNGTAISGTMIETPHTFSTACNIATQIVAQVASNQYGGQSISLAHLSPFVDVSRKKITKEVIEELDDGINMGIFDFEKDSEKYEKYLRKTVEKRLKKEINRGVQVIQYQVITLLTTNGWKCLAVVKSCEPAKGCLLNKRLTVNQA